MKQFDAIRILSKLSSSQWGLFTTAQAERSGVSRLQLSRLAKKMQIERVSFGVYQHEGAPSDMHQDVRAAWLSTKPEMYGWERVQAVCDDIIVGGHTAAHLYNAGVLWPTPFLFITGNRRQTKKTDVVFIQRSLNRDDITIVEGLPTTSPEYTIGTLVSEGHDYSHIEDVVRSLLDTRTIDKIKVMDGLLRQSTHFRNRPEEAKELVDRLFRKAYLAQYSAAVSHLKDKEGGSE